MKLILDGNSIANRAYYGIKPLTNSKGEFTHAVTGFLNIFLKLKTKFSPDGVYTVFDVSKKTFRNKMYGEYKGTRKSAPVDLLSQLERLREIMPLAGTSVVLPAVNADGDYYEADDVIGTLSTLLSREGDDVVIATGDRDMLQLIGDRVSVNYLTRPDDILYDTARLLTDKGVTPSQIVELKSLTGDASDNIPGVRGIGEKTALTLIQKYGSADEIYAALAADTADCTKSVRGKLEEGKKDCFLSRELARICTGADYEILQSVGGDARGRLREVLTELEMTATLAKLSAVLPQTGQAAPLDMLDRDGGGTLADSPLSAAIDAQSETAVGGQPQIPLGTPISAAVSGQSEPAQAERSLKQKLSLYLLDSKECYDIDGAVKQAGLEFLLNEVEIPLADVLSDMSLTGFAVDRDGLERYGVELRKSAEIIKKEVFAVTGEINLNSPKQLGIALFETLKLPHGKKTKTGAYSTDAETLEKLAEVNPVVARILEYRSLVKLAGTYAEGLMKAAVPTGELALAGMREYRVHSTFNQTEARTGRLSSSEPNIQNIPVRTDAGREFRKFFIAKEGCKLVGADYSQIELRVLAALSGDTAMTEAFKSGVDIHTKTAAAVFGVSHDLNLVTAEMRRAAKAVNFGIIYGMGAFSLAKTIGVDNGTAKAYIEAYRREFSTAMTYLDNTVAEAARRGYVSTLYGRRRYVHELQSPNKQMQAAGRRIALNTPIQGTAADIIKIAMVKAADKLRGMESKLILQVHDELIIESPDGEAETVAVMLKKAMESAVSFAVPLVVDVKTGRTWYECK